MKGKKQGRKKGNERGEERKGIGKQKNEGWRREQKRIISLTGN